MEADALTARRIGSRCEVLTLRHIELLGNG